MGHIRKKCSVIFFVFMCIFSTFGSVLLISAQDEVVPFVVRGENGPVILDPLDASDDESIATIMQVCEGLYIYNYSSPEMESIPCLADSMGIWSVDGLGYFTRLTIPLKIGVKFHDGSKFNASAVKWNFDRLQYWTYGFDIDGDGDLDNHPLGTASKTLFTQNGVPILNHTEIVDEYTITFHLNMESVIWEKLLAFVACSIVLPDPNYEYGEMFLNRININDELIGTGPFTLSDYIFDNEVVFDYFPEYHMPWGADHIERMIYLIVPDDVTASLAVLNHEIHWGRVNAEYDEQFAADPALVEIARKAFVVYYMQMNFYNMKFDYRYASSFIWNYTYFLEEVLDGRHYELHVPIPDGMQYHLADFDGEPHYDYEAAQDIILNSVDPDIQANLTTCGPYGIGLNATATQEEWRTVAESDNPLAVFNLTRYESSLVELVATLLQDYLKDIGIKLVVLDSMQWDDWVKDYIENPDGRKRLAYSFGGRGPDYNDPINMIEPLYGTNASNNCFGLNNDTWNQMLLDTYTLTGNERRDKFYEIQEHFVKYQIPSFYLLQLGGSVSFNREYLDEDSIGDLLNIFGHFYWFNCKFTPPNGCMPCFGPESIIIGLSVVLGAFIVGGMAIYGIIMIFVGLGKAIKNSFNKALTFPETKLAKSSNEKSRIYCPECGARVGTKLKICDYCGKLLEGEETNKYIDDLDPSNPTEAMKFCPMCGSVMKNQRCTKCSYSF